MTTSELTAALTQLAGKIESLCENLLACRSFDETAALDALHQFPDLMALAHALNDFSAFCDPLHRTLYQHCHPSQNHTMSPIRTRQFLPSVQAPEARTPAVPSTRKGPALPPGRLTASLTQLSVELKAFLDTLQTRPPHEKTHSLLSSRERTALMALMDALDKFRDLDKFLWFPLSQHGLAIRASIPSAVISDLDDMDDETVFSVYHLVLRMRPMRHLCASQIGSAIAHLKDVRPFVPLQELVFPDRTQVVLRARTVPRDIPEDALKTDDLPRFCMMTTLRGKHITRTILQLLVKHRAARILEHLVRTDNRLPCLYAPDKLLLLVLGFMNDDRVPQLVAAIEETYPGTVAAAEDASRRNALWHTFRFRSSSPIGPFHSDKVATALAQCLLSHGCDPDRVSSDGFSWRAMSRLLDILDCPASLA